VEAKNIPPKSITYGVRSTPNGKKGKTLTKARRRRRMKKKLTAIKNNMDEEVKVDAVAEPVVAPEEAATPVEGAKTE